MQQCAIHLNCSGLNYTLYANDGGLKFERCNDCGIIWRTKDSMEFEKKYEEDYFESKNYSGRRNHKVKKSGWLLDLARLHHPKISSLLEVGCSIGYTLEAAQQRGIKHLGTDISKYAVEYCNALNLNAQNKSFEELKQTGHKYDLIFKQHVLEHFQNPFMVLKDCHELLIDNGLILILVPNSDYYRAKMKRARHRFYSQQGVGAEHYAYFNYQNLEDVLASTGFKVVQKNYPVFGMPLFFI